MLECIFCNNLPKVFENSLAFAVHDIKPLSQGHMLIIPKRHYETLFESTTDEIKAIFDLINKAKGLIDQQYKPAAYNIAANCGSAAGQIVMHAHVHLIPKYV